jgi:outer membrane beta-barrel protein
MNRPRGGPRPGLRPLSLLASVLLALPALPSGRVLAAEEDEGGGSDDDGGNIVATRAPKPKRESQVRAKFFTKAKRVEITPQFGFISNNALNNEVMAGLAVTGHFSDRIGLEIAGNYALLGGTANTKNLAIAVMRVIPDASFKLESVDPGLFLTTSLLWSPMYGKINPAGMAVINLDFFFAFGLGYGNESIEMLSCPAGCPGRSQVQMAQKYLNHLFLLDFGFGARVFASKGFSLKLDARLYVTTDRILDYETPEKRAMNDNLGDLANRTDCDAKAGHTQGEDIFCKTVFPSTLVLGVGGSFWAPGDKAARAARARD